MLDRQGCLALQVTGDISYNGKGFDDFRAVHTSSYVDQNDLHQALLTVKETMNFAARVQGIGHKAGQCPAAACMLPSLFPSRTLTVLTSMFLKASLLFNVRLQRLNRICLLP